MQFKTRKLSYLSLHPDFRWDSQYLSCEPYKNKNLKYVPIGNTLASSQYGVSIEMNEDNIGTKIYRMNEISNMLCDRNILKYAKLNDDQIAAFKLKDRDVLFNRTNSKEFVGRTGIFKKFSDEDIVFASYLVRINPDPEIVTPEYLTTFLNTKYGIIDIKRRARHSINQSNVNLEEVKRIEIPLLCNQLQNGITLSFNKAVDSIQASEAVYNDAQTLLLAELGLADWQPKHRLTFVKSFSDTERAERIDADYFQPKYDDIVNVIREYPGGSDTLDNLCELVGHPSNPPYSDIDSEDKTFIVAQKHLGDYTLKDTYWLDDEAKHTTDQFVSKNPQYLLQKNDLVLYTVGGPPHIGKANIILGKKIKATIGSFVTLVRANQKKINPFLLLVLFNSPIGYLLTNRFQRGMVQQYIYPKDLIQTVIPILPEDKQAEIEQKVLEAFNLRNRAKDLLEHAKRAVEIAIEQDEQTAIAWLESVSEMP